MSELEIGRTLLLFVWAFGLAGIEIEIEGGYGWAERLPTWFEKRGAVGRVYGVVMGHRPLTGYHVFAFTIPVAHPAPAVRDGRRLDARRRAARPRDVLRARGRLGLPLVRAQPGVHGAAVQARATSGGSRFRGSGGSRSTTTRASSLSVVLAALAAWSAGDWSPLWRHLWMLAGLAVLIALTVLAAPLYHRWYRHMRRAGADDRAVTHMYPPPAPDAAWEGGVPDLRPLAGQETDTRRNG